MSSEVLSSYTDAQLMFIKHFLCCFTSNPFIEERVHPVEQGIISANGALQDHNIKLFTHARKGVLHYLEPQYQRIAQAAERVALFVKSQKVKGIFAANKDPLREWQSQAEIHELMGCLKEYYRAFRRDVPSYTKEYIEKLQGQFKRNFEQLRREKTWRQIRSMLHEQQKGTYTTKFTTLAKEVIDDMDQQYLEIRAARKVLFEHDLGEKGCDIDPELWRCDEMIDWTVDEPNMNPYLQIIID